MPEPAKNPEASSRPRAECSHCGRDTALTTKARVIGQHHGDDGSYRCPGVGQPLRDVPDPNGLLGRLAGITANLGAYIEHRARQIAALRTAEATAHREERTAT